MWKSGSIEPVQRVQVDDMIRSLRFTPSGEHVLLGDVTGRLRFLNLETSTSEMILDMGSTITCIDWTSVNGTTLVAAASTSGQVSLLNNLQPVNGGALSWTAHVPTDGPQDLQFGSIGKYAEVWSLVFAPPQFGCLLATASEDQSVVIWKIGANPVVVKREKGQESQTVVQTGYTIGSHNAPRAQGSGYVRKLVRQCFHQRIGRSDGASLQPCRLVSCVRALKRGLWAKVAHVDILRPVVSDRRSHSDCCWIVKWVSPCVEQKGRWRLDASLGSQVPCWVD